MLTEDSIYNFFEIFVSHLCNMTPIRFNSDLHVGMNEWIWKDFPLGQADLTINNVNKQKQNVFHHVMYHHHHLGKFTSNLVN